MTKVDFHEVKGARRQLALCEQVERAASSGQGVYVWAASEAQARELDDLLWTFRDGSFVPHGLWQGEDRCDEPVAVGWRPGNPNGAGCLVLARDAAPDDVAGFACVIDFAPVDDPRSLEVARQRYKAFQRAGFTMAFHPAPL